MPPEADGQRFRAKIVQAIDDYETNIEKDRMKFLCSINDDEKEELLSYNDIMNYIDTSGEQYYGNTNELQHIKDHSHKTIKTGMVQDIML
jgi:hypothetical protein